MMRYLSLLFILFLSALKVNGQQFYICTSNLVVESVTITNGSCASQLVTTCPGNYFSIAMIGNTFYYSDGQGQINKGDIINGVISNCSVVCVTGISNSALTVDGNGILYYVAGNALFKLDPANPKPIFLGTMPYSSGGDLTFYNNQLYMASSTNSIIKVNISNPSASTSYISVPPSVYGSLYGMVTVIANGVYKVYGLGTIGGNTNLVELDMVNQKVVGITCTLPYVVYDAASVAESNVIKKVAVSQIQVAQQCDALNQGEIQVVCPPDTDKSTLTYTLNNTSNSTGLFTNLVPGAYAINITSSKGASTDTTATVPDYSMNIPAIQPTITNAMCGVGGSIQFNTAANGNYNIQYGSAIYPFNHSFTGLAPGGYHFTALSQSGCIIDTLYAAIAQVICPQIKIDSIVVTPQCDALWKGKVQVYCAAHVDTYTYFLNQVSSNTTGIFNNVLAGNYALHITSGGGYTKDTTLTVPDYSLFTKPLTAFSIKNQLCDLSGQIGVTVNGYTDTTYKVELGTGTAFASGHIFKNLTAGSYNFTILSNKGCLLDTLSVAVGRDICNPVIFPNTFTPNNDGINDIFEPNQDATVTNYKLTIFDRWGAVVFVSTDFHTGWNGQYKGKPVTTGTYYWIAAYANITGKRDVQKGSITVIR